MYRSTSVKQCDNGAYIDEYQYILVKVTQQIRFTNKHYMSSFLVTVNINNTHIPPNTTICVVQFELSKVK